MHLSQNEVEDETQNPSFLSSSRRKERAELIPIRLQILMTHLQLVLQREAPRGQYFTSMQIHTADMSVEVLSLHSRRAARPTARNALKRTNQRVRDRITPLDLNAALARMRGSAADVASVLVHCIE